MRNLRVTGDRREELAVPTELGEATRLAVDSDGGLLFVAGTGLAVAAFRASDCQLLWCADVRERLEAAGGRAAPPGAQLAAFDFVPELDALCVALSSGELLLLPASAAAPGAAEEVGTVQGGLAAGAWSPDGELLALVTCGGGLLLMTKDWELLSEVPLQQQRDQPLGAAAAAAALGTLDGAAAQQHGDAAGAGAPAAAWLAPGSVGISWRGDGRYFATASLDAPGASAATVRVWERETGELHAQGEAAAGLLPVLAWQPNGRHLYAAAHRPAAAAQQQAQQVQQAQQEQRQPGGQGGAAPPLHRHQQTRPDELEAAEAAAAEGIQHVGAWKRELRRRQAAGGTAGGSAAAAEVLLFERNGLRHGGFALPPGGGGGAAAIEQLAWSGCSEFLAVVAAEQDADGLPQQAVQLWHRSNWRWYLKAERRYDSCTALHCSWDAAQPLTLHLLSAEGTYERLEFARQPDVSARGTAAVVDGASLLLTPLRHTVVPPPMCAAAAAMPAPVACLALRDFGDREAVAAVLSDGRMALLAAVEEDLWGETLEEQLEGRPWQGPGEPRLLPAVLAVDSPALAAAAATGGGSVQAAAWLGERRLLLALAMGSASSGLLVELSVDEAAAAAAEVAAVAAGVPPLRGAASRPGGGALLQARDGGLLAYAPGGRLQALPPAAGFPCGCQQLAALPEGAAGAQGPTAPPALGLSGRGQLLWGRRQLAGDVTSFALRASGPGGPQLLYTTRQHALHTLPLSELEQLAQQAQQGQQTQQTQQQAQQAQQRATQQGFMASMRAAMRPGGGAGAGGGVRVRAIEQHALLVAVPPGGVQAVLQMPRGNLEAVRPRALVLPAVADALDAGDFAAAWELATTNRLDLNLLADYRWPALLGQAGAMVQQVPEDADLADFLSALSEESVAAPGGLYAAALPPPPAQQPPPQQQQPGEAAASEGPEAAAGGGKVAAVCGAVRTALEHAGAGRYLRAILTSHAKCGQLEAALELVRQAKEAALQGGAPPPGGTSAEDGLRHLLLFTPDDTLYRTALGMYHLELAYMVVAHSQKDPGEYLLELQRFAAQPDPHLRRHAIDAHLGRWERALAHLVAAGPAHHAAALELARERGLLRLLLRLHEGDPERQRDVSSAYAEALEARNLQEDAGLAYAAAGRLDDAVRAYRAAGAWRMAFGLAAKAGWGEAERRRLAAAVAEELGAAGRAAEAAEVTLLYLEDLDSAVLLLAHGREWREALRLAWGAGRQDLVDTVVAPRAAAAAAALLEESAANEARVAKYGARLRQLRERRQGLEAALAAADAESGLPSRQALDPLNDGASVADSLASGLSAYTDHTHAASEATSASSVATTVGGKRRARKPKARARARRAPRARRPKLRAGRERARPPPCPSRRTAGVQHGRPHPAGGATRGAPAGGAPAGPGAQCRHLRRGGPAGGAARAPGPRARRGAAAAPPGRAGGRPGRRRRRRAGAPAAAAGPCAAARRARRARGGGGRGRGRCGGGCAGGAAGRGAAAARGGGRGGGAGGALEMGCAA